MDARKKRHVHFVVTAGIGGGADVPHAVEPLDARPVPAAREGAKRGTGYSRELALYLVHGLLHAAGEDDLDPKARRRMRRREREVMAELDRSFDFSAVFPEHRRSVS